MHLLKVILITTITAIVFFQFPVIDLSTSSLFFHEEHGFALSYQSKILMALSNLIYVVIAMYIIGIIGSTIYVYVQKRSMHYKHYIKILYVVSTCIIGGFGVVYMCKDCVHRARPVTIKEFGGAFDFTPAFVIANQCTGNCSFVSGHAAVGFLAFALIFITRNQKLRYTFALLALFLGCLIGFSRIALGRHFLSDVVFAGLFVYITAYVMAVLFGIEDMQNEKKIKNNIG